MGASPSINAPKIENLQTLRATVRAINTVDQIYSICEAMFDPGSERNLNNGVIANQMNDAPPFGVGENKRKAKGYAHNFSTGFLSGIIEPAAGSPIDVIDKAGSLTSASLDDKDDPSGTKTEAYRRKFTKLLKSWDGFRTHIYNVFQETVCYGYNAVAVDDPDDWRPEECRQDEFGVPDNTGQHARKCQFFGRRKSFYIHELIDKLVKQPEGAKGPWDIEACVKALNEAMPEDRSTTGDATTPSNRSFADLVRDGNAGAAHDPRARTVDVYILLATEADGKVSKFIVTQRGTGNQGASATTTAVADTRRVLYESLDEFEKLSDVVMFYSLKPGSGTLYSSKGGGRDLINIALSQERGRNKSADHTYLGSKIWMWSEKGMVAVQMKVLDTCAVIGSEAKVQADALPDRSDAFDRLDERLTRYAEQKFGQYIAQKPSRVDPKKEKTATETRVEEKQDMQTEAAWLKRLFGQFGDEVSLIARKAGDPSSRDDEAKAWRKDLEDNDGITPELLKKLVNQNQGQMIEDLTQQRTVALIQAAPFIMQSQFFDKYKYQRELATRTIGKELTDRFMFKNGIDPNDEAAQINYQLMENDTIRNGGSLPAVANHDHRSHLKTVVGTLDRSEPRLEAKVKDGSALQEPELIDNWEALVKHGDGHVHHWGQQAAAVKNEDELKEVGGFKNRLAQSDKKIQKALEDLKAQKKQREGEMAKRPQMMPGPQGPGQQMPMELLKAWVAHYKELKPDLQRQLEIMSGMKPHQGGNGAIGGDVNAKRRSDGSSATAGAENVPAVTAPPNRTATPELTPEPAGATP
jgi:hypothetical protein